LKRSITGYFLLAFVWLSLGIARADDDRPTPQVLWVYDSPSALTVSLEANGGIFVAGQPVLLRISMANHSKVGIRENFTNAWLMFALKITDKNGATFKPNIAPIYLAAATYIGHPSALWPGESFVITGETQERYTNLQAWGYQLTPGDYRVTAFQKFGNGAEVDSNPITIVVH
jgi:hypothetical protein